MIEAFTGLPGQGKTYLMVRKAMQLQKKGKKIYSNFALNLPEVERWRELSDLFTVRDGVILMDEASLVLPSGSWSSVPVEVWAYWRQHRHKGVEMYYTAQSFAEVAKGLRSVTQFVTRVHRIGPPKEPWFITWKSVGAQDRVKYGGWFTFFNPEVAAAYDTFGEDVDLQSFAKTGYGRKGV